jgi:secondary thiamine-phosphate synthase enzyme
MAQRITSDGRPVELDAAWKASVAQEEVRQAEGAGWRTVTLYLWLHTKERRAIVALTDRIRRAVRESGVREGFVLVSAMHISAAVYVNDYESGIMEDMMALLDRLAPYRRDYRHHRTGEDNADAHLKSLLLHHQVIVPVTAGDLDLGPWQQVFYAEFDGQRRKRVIVKVLGVA